MNREALKLIKRNNIPDKYKGVMNQILLFVQKKQFSTDDIIQFANTLDIKIDKRDMRNPKQLIHKIVSMAINKGKSIIFKKNDLSHEELKLLNNFWNSRIAKGFVNKLKELGVKPSDITNLVGVASTLLIEKYRKTHNKKVIESLNEELQVYVKALSETVSILNEYQSDFFTLMFAVIGVILIVFGFLQFLKDSGSLALGVVCVVLGMAIFFYQGHLSGVMGSVVSDVKKNMRNQVTAADIKHILSVMALGAASIMLTSIQLASVASSNFLNSHYPDPKWDDYKKLIRQALSARSQGIVSAFINEVNKIVTAIKPVSDKRIAEKLQSITTDIIKSCRAQVDEISGQFTNDKQVILVNSLITTLGISVSEKITPDNAKKVLENIVKTTLEKIAHASFAIIARTFSSNKQFGNVIANLVSNTQPRPGRFLTHLNTSPDNKYIDETLATVMTKFKEISKNLDNASVIFSNLVKNVK